MTIGKRAGIALMLAVALLVGGPVGTLSAATSGASETGNEKASAKEEAKKIPAEVSAVLKDVAAYYSKRDSMKLQASLTLSVQGPGLEQTMSQDMTLMARRPNKLVLNIERGMLGGKAISDGEALYTYFPDQDAYLKDEAPEDFGALNEIPTLIMLYSRSAGPPVMLNLLHPEPYEALTKKVTGASYQGAEKVHGNSCHHLKLTQDKFDWEVWVRKGDTPLVEKVRTDLTRAFKQASKQKAALKDLTAHSVAELSSWEADPELAKETFQFKPPEKATQYSSMIDMLRSKQGEAGSQEGALLGKDAPDFTAPLLSGKEVTLSDHKGSDVVILDFWATWCPPCKKAMPKLEAIAEKYSGKSVAVYAVNQQEGKEKVRQFMNDRDLGLTVMLDKQGDIGDAYNVRGIPHTVLIGKGGTVQATHTGYSPGMKQKISSQIDKLLAGESLVESGDE